MIKNNISNEFYKSVPKKSMYSLLLLFCQTFFYLPIFRKLIIKYGLHHCKNVSFEPGFRFFYGDNIYAENVHFGNTLIMDYARVTIGEYTVLSRDNKIITASHDYQDRNRIIATPITIGKNVWISTDCIILPGAVIGDNTIIGAGSVVSGTIPANSIAAGNPCVVKKKVDDEGLIPFSL